MSAQLDEKLVVAVASSALFDLSAADTVFRNEGVSAYRAYQRAHERVTLRAGAAFPLIRRLLAFNSGFGQRDGPVEVVLLSRNDPDSGLRILNSIAAHRLSMSRAVFVSGRNPYPYARALGSSLFLSSNINDVRIALDSGVPAGRVCPSTFEDDADDAELRIAFDFDGVLADDASERVFQSRGLDAFQQSEYALAATPLDEGPLARFGRQISRLQQMASGEWGVERPMIRTAIVTSRGAPAHTRVVNTLRSWGISVDEAYFLAGLSKTGVLSELRPHIFFDDQVRHLHDLAATPCAHVPFGVLNQVDAFQGGSAPTSTQGRIM